MVSIGSDAIRGDEVVIVKIFDGVAKHFPIRRSEWINAGMMMGWGALLTYQPALFESSPIYSHMAKMGDELIWGFWTVVIGAVRLAALFINGSFHDRWYSRYSPFVRAVMSLASCFLWVQLLIGIYASGATPPGIVLYVGLAISDLLNAFSATGDAAKSKKAGDHEPD